MKKILLSLICGSALLAFAGAASAAPTADINIYGASAQFNFWKAEAANFLTDEGCTVNGSQTSADNKNFIVNATCGKNSVNIRVSSKASYDGVLAAQGNTTNTNRGTACGGDATKRSMLASIADNTTMGCFDVTIGASDVVVTDFTQTSQGFLQGPYEGSAANFKRYFSGANAVTETGVTDYCRPLVVPFAFFINNSVKLDDGLTQPSDISLTTAKIIFGSTVLADWSDLPGYAPSVINVCYRHAGSGTHATINSLIKTISLQLPGTKVGATYDGSSGYYFNDGSSDMMKCVNGAPGPTNGLTWSGTGAIGYADADQVVGTGTYASTHRLTLNGVAPSRANVINRSYPPFWTPQNMYVTPADAANAALIDLCNHAVNPKNVHRNNAYWAPTCAFPEIPVSLYSPWVYNVNQGNKWDFQDKANGECTAVGVPFGCCTGPNQGTCSVFDCTGFGIPYHCCTAAGLGTCNSPQNKTECIAAGNPYACCTGPGAGDCCGDS
ncbi:MAG TPA: hypothetical protein VMV04_15170 [Thermodesulfobacteriota bacterium]|nr:hypothetical protein [Thermodesulfobacteriota bacterium]